MKKITFSLLTLFIASVLISCASVKEIPEDKSAAQIIQMGQNAVSALDYKSALLCYNTALDRFGDDTSIYAEVTYEIGHVYLKQKKYDKAYQTFTGLIDLYDSTMGVFPPAYKKLAKIGLSQIPENKLALIKAN